MVLSSLCMNPTRLGLSRYRQVEDLHIKIDQDRKARQVEAITGTEYFKGLQVRAGVLLLEREKREASKDRPS